MSTDHRVYPDPMHARQALVVRGVCGALLGVVIAGVVWMRSGGFGPMASFLLFAGAIVACVVGAIRHGDSFWYGVLRRGR